MLNITSQQDREEGNRDVEYKCSYNICVIGFVWSGNGQNDTRSDELLLESEKKSMKTITRISAVLFLLFHFPREEVFLLCRSELVL